MVKLTVGSFQERCSSDWFLQLQLGDVDYKSSDTSQSDGYLSYRWDTSNNRSDTFNRWDTNINRWDTFPIGGIPSSIVERPLQSVGYFFQ
jgi:hypothetical protein